MSLSLKKCVSKEQFFSIKDKKRRTSHPRAISIENNACSKKKQHFESKNFGSYLGVNIKQSVTTTAESEKILKFRKKPLLTKKKAITYQRKVKTTGSIQKMQIMNKQMFYFIKKLGGGTYSEVYQSIHRPTGLVCAIKIFKKAKFVYQNMKQHLIKQITLHNKLQHPNIVQLWGFFSDEACIYLILEPCTDSDLYTMLNSLTSLNFEGISYRKVAGYIGQICRAVQQLHSNNIIHRDIKPENILLTMGQTIKLCDFGESAKTDQSGLRKTLCGTPLYLAPQLINQSQYGNGIDVWAIGIVTYQLLTGRMPFKIRSIGDLRKIVEDQVIYQDIKSKKAIDFIKNMLQKNGQKRITINNVLNHQFLKKYQETNQ